VDSVALGNKFTVVLSSDGQVFSFGDGKHFVLGTGNQSSSFNPVRLDLAHIKKISVGWSHSLAMTTTGQVYTWGDQYSEINKTVALVKVPTHVQELRLRAIDIAAGDYHSAALTINNNLVRDVYTWGGNGFAQLGYDTAQLEDPYLVLSPRVIPQLSGQASQLQCGGCSSYVLTLDGRVYAWGSNKADQFGPGMSAIVREPTVIFESRGQRITELEAGHSHLILLTRWELQESPGPVTTTELAEIHPAKHQANRGVTVAVDDAPDIIHQA
jgi:alpha-tubulin suppressor-like RCC1 family protein